MRLAFFGALFLALGLGGSYAPARAGLFSRCSQEDSHGRCLVCYFSYEDFTLRPGEVARPFECPAMARDPRVTLVVGGTGTVEGPPSPYLRIGLRIWRDGRGSHHLWGPNINTMPVGPVSIPLGRTLDGEVVSPNFALTACGPGRWPAATCHFTLSGHICLTGMC